MNISELKQKIRKSREIVVPWEHFEVICRRPTETELGEWQFGAGIRGSDDYNDTAKALTLFRTGLKFVTGWRNVKQVDIVPEANGIDAPFDRDLLVELADRNKGLESKITTEIMLAYENHVSQEDDEKKS